MAQGSINMPGFQQGQMSQVAAALQAVHDFYGIDTEKQRQALLKAQTAGEEQKTTDARNLSPLALAKAQAESRGEKARADVAEAEAQETSNLINKGILGPQMAVKAGYLPTPNGATGGGSSKGSGGVGGGPMVTLPNGQQVQFQPNLKVQQEQAGLQKTLAETSNARKTGQKLDLELGSLPKELKTKENAPVIEAGKTLYTQAEPEINAIKFLKSAQQNLANGGPITAKQAVSDIEKAQGTFSRLSPETQQELLEPMGKLNQLKEGFLKNKSGNLEPEQRAQIQDIYDSVQGASVDAFNRKKASVIALHGPGTNIPENELDKRLSVIVGGLASQGEGKAQAKNKDTGSLLDQLQAEKQRRAANPSGDGASDLMALIRAEKERRSVRGGK